MIDHVDVCDNASPELFYVETHLAASLAIAAREMAEAGRSQQVAAETLRWMLTAVPSERVPMLVDRILSAAIAHASATRSRRPLTDEVFSRLEDVTLEAAHEHVAELRRRHGLLDGDR